MIEIAKTCETNSEISKFVLKSFKGQTKYYS